MSYTSGSGSQEKVDNITITRDNNEALTFAADYYSKQSQQDLQLLRLEAVNNSGLIAFEDQDLKLGGLPNLQIGSVDATTTGSNNDSFAVVEFTPNKEGYVGALYLKPHSVAGDYEIEITSSSATDPIPISDTVFYDAPDTSLQKISIPQSKHDTTLKAGTSYELKAFESNSTLNNFIKSGIGSASASGDISSVSRNDFLFPSTPQDLLTYVSTEKGLELNNATKDVYIYSRTPTSGQVELRKNGNSKLVDLNVRTNISFTPNTVVDVNSLGVQDVVVIYL